MKPLQVFKFGGTSVGSAERMLASSGIVETALEEARVVVVASAMSKVTDTLLRAAASAVEGRRTLVREEMAALRTRHEETLAAIAQSTRRELEVEGTLEQIHALLQELSSLLEASLLLGELTPRTRDRIVITGEKLSVRLLACAMRSRGIQASPMDADTFLETDGNFGEANPLSGIADRTIQAALEPLLEKGEVPVVTGFCGRGPDGATTTLGRGGSDLTATVIAAALRASEVTLWSDVDGVYSADPRIVPEARVIPQLNFREAAEMSYYGAKVLHQRTMIPVSGLGIPVRSRNSMRPEAPGTVVDGRFTPGSHPVKAITAVRGHSLIALEGKGMSGVPGVSARLFGALAQLSISVTMISQSSSEASICFAVPARDALKAESALKKAFREDISRGLVEEISVRQNIGLVAAVGLGMARTPGVAARFFSAVSSRGANILAIAQGSSELNISLAVDESEIPTVIKAAHEEFGLHRKDTGVDEGQHFDVLLMGCGKVGRALLGLLQERQKHIQARFGLSPRIVAMADRSGYLFAPAGLSSAQLSAALEAKSAGSSLASVQGSKATSDPRDMIREALSWRLVRPVLVDVSDASVSVDMMRDMLHARADVVTANKKPLAGPLQDYEFLMNAPARGGIFKAEATVGAGLPVVDTLEVLLATGDKLFGAEGCFSGTLGFVMARLEEGVLFSQAVSEAMEAGYTEPDPAVDLCGMDVARKATILGRLSGLAKSDEPVSLTGLVDLSMVGQPLDVLMAHLKELDEGIAARVARAKEAGERLRFVARVEEGSIVVGPTEVPADSPLGMLQGTDNMIVFSSERYKSRPLVVSGPGAGIDVTAMGVLGDVLRVVAERK